MTSTIFADIACQSFSSLNFNRATARQVAAAKRFAGPAGLSTSQAVKRLEELMYVSRRAESAGVSFADAWREYESL